MMKQLIYIMLMFLGSTLPASAANKMKLISYNIWNGFEWGKETVRKQKLLHWMDVQKPDVVALQELCAYTDEKLASDAKAWGHQHSILLKTSGYSVGLTSKHPILLKERIMEGMHHGALHCQTNGIEVFVVHLSPFQWRKRMEEADILLKRIECEINAGNKVLVCGDFNALSPMDHHLYKDNTELLESSKESDRKHQHVNNLNSGNFCFTTISQFIAAGLFDVTAKFTSTISERYSYPTMVFAKNEADKKRQVKSGTRIDYILCSGTMFSSCVNAKVENGNSTALLSDHYPVIAVFE